MVHVIFDTSTPSYDDFVQVGGGAIDQGNDFYRGLPPFQRGYGLQRGAGIGDVFRGLWRFIFPFVKQLGTTVSAEAFNTGQRVLERVNQGEALKEAIMSEGKKSYDNMLERGGLPKQFGTGRKGIKRKRKLMTDPNSPLIGHTIIKPLPTSIKKKKRRQRSDTFGFY